MTTAADPRIWAHSAVILSHFGGSWFMGRLPHLSGVCAELFWLESMRCRNSPSGKWRVCHMFRDDAKKRFSNRHHENEPVATFESQDAQGVHGGRGPYLVGHVFESHAEPRLKVLMLFA